MPLYGPLNTVVPAETAGGVAEAADRFFRRRSGRAAGRDADRPPDRRPLPRPRAEAARSAAAYLAKENAPGHFVALVQSGGRLDREEQGLVFGESLPKGLRLA